MKILILAGGRGTRLWPLSRKYKPKQFQKLLGKKTMLQRTFERARKIVRAENIFISTNEFFKKEVKKEIPQLPKNNLILEPAFRERVAAFLLVLTFLKEKDKKEPLVIFPSDHLIKKEKEFRKAVISGEKFIKKNPDFILLFGQKPNFPDVGLGYLKKGKILFKEGKFKFYKVSKFKEKPNLKRAKEYLKSRDYFWNIGVFIFFPNLFEKLVEKFVPDNYLRYKNIKKAIKNKNFKKVLKREYLKMDKVSFDYSILENYGKIAFLPVDIGWSDIGSWAVFC